MNFVVNYSFTKSIFVTDATDEKDAIMQSKAFLLNVLNQIEDNQELVDTWMEIKVKKGESTCVELRQ